jgi:hypothetical protein
MIVDSSSTPEINRSAPQVACDNSRKRGRARITLQAEGHPAIAAWSQLFIIELGSASIARLLHSLLVGEPAATLAATSTRQEARHGGSEIRP